MRTFISFSVVIMTLITGCKSKEDKAMTEQEVIELVKLYQEGAGSDDIAGERLKAGGEETKAVLIKLLDDPDTPEDEGAVNGETILLVEDDASVREVARIVLEKQGYTVLEATSGPEALRLAANYGGYIHLLLTDVVMPVMSGDALAVQLAECYPNLKTLFMSGYTDDTIVRHSVLEPGMLFLQKPFSAMELDRKVRAALES